MDAVAKIGRNPVSKYQIQPDCVENEHADAGLGEARQGKKHFLCSADHEQDDCEHKAAHTYS